MVLRILSALSILFVFFSSGEAKRKVLPAWLRDELEKMEARRQKELEKEKEAKERGAREGHTSWRDEIDSEEEEDGKKEEKKGWAKRSYRQKSPSPKTVSNQYLYCVGTLST